MSYNHKDSERVLPILNAMNAAGYRVWYDEGIPWTSEWPDVIAQHILNCGICMAFHSSTSVESDHCRREIRFSQSEHKPILSAYLEDVKKPVIKYELGMYQSVKLRNATETNEFLSNLQKQDCFRACQAETSDVLGAEQPEQAIPTFQKEKTISAGNTYTTAEQCNNPNNQNSALIKKCGYCQGHTSTWYLMNDYSLIIVSDYKICLIFAG